MTFNDRHTITRRDLLKAGGATGIALTAGCTGLTGGSGPYEIGMVDSLTGSLAPYGERNKNGKELALSAINEAGGPNDRDLEIMVEDDGSTNQQGVSAAQKLVNQEGVPLLIGSVGSGVSIAIHDSVISGTDTVQISQNSTSPELTNYPKLNRMSPSGAAKGKALAKLVAEDGHDTVALTWINNDYGSGLGNVFADSFEGNVAYNNPHDQGGSSYRGILGEMANTDATAWVMITYADEFTVMVNEAYDNGYNEQFDYYGAESTVADEILENTEKGSQESLKGITESAPSGQDSYETFKSDYESEFGDTPTVWSAYAYDAVTVSAIAIQAADDFSGSAIESVVRDITRPEGTEVFTFEEAKNALSDGGSPSDINYQGVSGPVDLDENGDPPGFYQVYEVNDHEYEYGDYITG